MQIKFNAMDLHSHSKYEDFKYLYIVYTYYWEMFNRSLIR